jgi:hypothetical protein
LLFLGFSEMLAIWRIGRSASPKLRSKRCGYNIEQ